MDDLTNDDLIALLCENGADLKGMNDVKGIRTVLLNNPSWDEPWMLLQAGSLPVPNDILTRIGKNYIRRLLQSRQTPPSAE